LDKVYAERFAKENPGADPKDIKYQELENRFNAAEKGRLKETLTNKALKVAQEKKLPTDLIDYMVGEDEDSTNANLEKLSKIFIAHDEEIRKEFAKGNSYTPPGSKTTDNLSGDDKIRAQMRKAMGIKEKTK
jgi:hypothetical protein